MNIIAYRLLNKGFVHPECAGNGERTLENVVTSNMKDIEYYRCYRCSSFFVIDKG